MSVVGFFFVRVAFEQPFEQVDGARRIGVVLLERFGEQPLSLGKPIELSLDDAASGLRGRLFAKPLENRRRAARAPA